MAVPVDLLPECLTSLTLGTYCDTPTQPLSILSGLKQLQHLHLFMECIDDCHLDGDLYLPQLQLLSIACTDDFAVFVPEFTRQHIPATCMVRMSTCTRRSLKRLARPRPVLSAHVAPQRRYVLSSDDDDDERHMAWSFSMIAQCQDYCQGHCHLFKCHAATLTLFLSNLSHWVDITFETLGESASHVIHVLVKCTTSMCYVSTHFRDDTSRPSHFPVSTCDMVH